ncbi:hypothetical protein HNR03_000163 [Pseudomonas sp. JAI111]|nr:hypothetical protein [Pseudomonas sp. JAI111]
MIGEAIQEDVLRALVSQHAVRECLVAKADTKVVVVEGRAPLLKSQR